MRRDELFLGDTGAGFWCMYNWIIAAKVLIYLSTEVLLFANTNIFCQNKYFSSCLERGRGVGAAASYVTAIGSMSLADRCEQL